MSSASSALSGCEIVSVFALSTHFTLARSSFGTLVISGFSGNSTFTEWITAYFAIPSISSGRCSGLAAETNSFASRRSKPAPSTKRSRKALAVEAKSRDTTKTKNRNNTQQTQSHTTNKHNTQPSKNTTKVAEC